MKITVPKGVTRAFYRSGAKIRKHSPEIMLGVGIVSMLGAIVTASKNTPKARAVIEESRTDLEKIETCTQREDIEYSDETRKKDLVIVYTRTIVGVVKAYAVPAALTALGIVSILTSYGVMKKRNVALTATCAALANDLKSYRDNVVKRFGEKVDRQLRFGAEEKEIETVVKDGSGNEREEKRREEVMRTDTAQFSEFARCFDEFSRYYSKNAEANLVFIRAREAEANDMLISRGHLFLNEVYDMLDLPRTKAGQVVGWVYDKNNTKGDNYVSFGIYNPLRENSRAFVNGYERAVWIDPNVDGTILDKI